MDSASPVSVAPDEFISAIFAGIDGSPVVSSLRAATAARRAAHLQFPWWPGFFAGTPMPGGWYFCISTTNTIEDGGVAHRRKADLAATACIVLDDVGTKVDGARVEAMLPAPSWLLMTSTPNGRAGNYQWGYILAGGAKPDDAAALLARLADIGLTDAGAKDAAHVFRLPGSLNDKCDPPFAAQLEEWAPDRRYTLAELAEKLPPAHDDTLVAWLERRGMVYRHRGDGGLDIACPWAPETHRRRQRRYVDDILAWWPRTQARVQVPARPL